MVDMEYAIVDIETTGGHAAGNRITEVSIHIHNGIERLHRYDTLINPGTSIPFYISGLTGITNEMVREAPPFSAVAAAIYELLNNRVFVAHSVNFDYSFLKNALMAHGYELNCRKLCTVRLSRKVFLGLPSYSLGNLCGSLDIPLVNRHRAGGDAEVTVILFERILQTDALSVMKFLKRGSREQALPPNLPREEFEQLPATTGVYYFLNRKGKVVYVGKAVNLKKRVSSHFSNNFPSKQKQDFMRDIFHLRLRECADEEAAFALESAEIKKLWPIYNRAQKGYEPLYGIVQYEDQNGFYRLALKKLKNKREALVCIPGVLQGHEIIRQMVAEYDLCLRLSGIPKSRISCLNERCICSKKGKDTRDQYNEQVISAMMGLEENSCAAKPVLITSTVINLFSD